MVTMCVADKDMANRPSSNRSHQRLKMRFIFRAGVDHCQRFAAQKVAVRATKGESTGIVDREPHLAIDLQVLCGSGPRSRNGKAADGQRFIDWLQRASAG